MRRLVTVTLLLSAALLAGACGGSDGSDDLTADERVTLSSYFGRAALDRSKCATAELEESATGYSDARDRLDPGLGGAANKAIKVLRVKPDAQYEPGLTLRAAMADDALGLYDCRPEIAARIDTALSQLPPAR